MSRAEWLKEWRKKNPEAAKRHSYAADQRRKHNPERQPRVRLLKSRYGLTTEQYDSMLKAQNSRCAICVSTSPGRSGVTKFAVDHCHATGKIRGLLCYKCNIGIGYFKDNVEYLEAAITYLKDKKHET